MNTLHLFRSVQKNGNPPSGRTCCTACWFVFTEVESLSKKMIVIFDEQCAHTRQYRTSQSRIDTVLG